MTTRKKTPKHKATPRKALFEVATRWIGQETKYTCVLAVSKGSAIRTALGAGAKVVDAEDDNYWVIPADSKRGAPMDVFVRRGCACVKGSR